MSLQFCEVWHFDKDGQMVSGNPYYDQCTLLTQFGYIQPLAAAASNFAKLLHLTGALWRPVSPTPRKWAQIPGATRSSTKLLVSHIEKRVIIGASKLASSLSTWGDREPAVSMLVVHPHWSASL